MPSNNKARSLRTKSLRKIKPLNCSCNCDNSKTNQDSDSKQIENRPTKREISRNEIGTRNKKIVAEPVLENTLLKRSLRNAQESPSPIKNKRKIKRQTTLKTTKERLQTKEKTITNRSVNGSKLEILKKINGVPKKTETVITECYVLLTRLPKTVIESNLITNKPHIIKKKTQTAKATTPQLSLTKTKLTKGVNLKSALRKSQKNNSNHVGAENLREKIIKEVQINCHSDSHETVRNKVKRDVGKPPNALNEILANQLPVGPKKSARAAKLRKRKTVDYAESSIEISTKIESKPNKRNRVPVYQQQINNENKRQQQGDLYDFDSDSEKCKKRKKRKLNNSSSDEFNEAIQHIVKNAVNNIKRKNKKKVFHDKNNVKAKKVNSAPERPNGVRNKHIVTVSSRRNVNKIEKNIALEEKKHDNASQKLPLENLDEVEDLDEGGINDDNSSDGLDLCFGFDKTEPVKANSKIKIISNIQLGNELNFSITTPTKFKEGRPNANSTMLNNILTPWRYNNINIKRNPHFIALKESALPCITQEMVLDHSIVSKLGDVLKTETGNTPRQTIETHFNRKKTPIQKTVTDYFNSNKENKENSQVSLFDNDNFSPIKHQSRFGSKVDLVKRKILGQIDDNVIVSQVHVSTPKQNKIKTSLPDITSMEQSQRDFTNFGFDSSDEENDSDILKRNRDNNIKKNKNDRPFRLSININDKKYKGRRKFKKVESAPSVASGDEENHMSDMDDSENEYGEIRLFEDLDKNNDNILKEPKFKKNKKLQWLNGGSRDPQKYKKRKDVRTKEEEEKAEKWAEAFNSMCEEIEDFPLEIE